MELTVTSFLRALMTKHRTGIVQPLRPCVEQIVFERGAHTRSRSFRPQSQAVPVEMIQKGVHLFFDDVRDGANGTHEQIGLLHDWHADVTVAIGRHPVTNDLFEKLPKVYLIRQDVIHPANCLYSSSGH